MLYHQYYIWDERCDKIFASSKVLLGVMYSITLSWFSGWSVQEGVWPLWLWEGGRCGAQDGGRRGAVQVRAQGGEDDGRQQDVTVDGEWRSQWVSHCNDKSEISLQNGNSWTPEDIAAKTRNLQKFNKFTSWRFLIICNHGSMGYYDDLYQLHLVLEMVSFNCDTIFCLFFHFDPELVLLLRPCQ